MRIVVFGATGRTGVEFIRQATAARHDVSAVARRPANSRLNSHLNDQRIRVLTGDALDPDFVSMAVADQDAVVSALGPHSLQEPTTVYSGGATNILRAMRNAGVFRFIAISATPVGRDREHRPLRRYVIFPLLYSFFGPAYEDMKRMEEICAASDRNWTIFRPPQLVDRPGTGCYRTAIDTPLERSWSVSRADLAAAMLAAINDSRWCRHIVTIAS